MRRVSGKDAAIEVLRSFIMKETVLRPEMADKYIDALDLGGIRFETASEARERREAIAELCEAAEVASRYLLADGEDWKRLIAALARVRKAGTP